MGFSTKEELSSTGRNEETFQDVASISSPTLSASLQRLPLRLSPIDCNEGAMAMEHHRWWIYAFSDRRAFESAGKLATHALGSPGLDANRAGWTLTQHTPPRLLSIRTPEAWALACVRFYLSRMRSLGCMDYFLRYFYLWLLRAAHREGL